MVKIAVSTGMFPEEAKGFLTEHASGWFERGGEPGAWVVDEEDGEVVGVAFYEPREATDRVWYLTMLAISPAWQAKGRGATLLRWVEDALRKDDQRLLLIETSGTEAYARTRAFYAKLDYEQVARVADYFTDGDDMVLFRKDLRG